VVTLRPKAAPRILGLTGPIACGKTTVGDLLLDLGALERIDADRVVHELEGSDTPTAREIRTLFGDEVMNPDGSVNRQRLGGIVFANPEALRRLEGVVHPAVRSIIRARLEKLRDRAGVVVVDAVRLLQSDLLPMCDAVWVVQCPANAQMRRLTEIRKMDAAAAMARLAAQPSFEHPRVTEVITNAGSLQKLRRQVESAWQAALKAWEQSAE